jgi:DNA-binding NarL/FixJ family response regulator
MLRVLIADDHAIVRKGLHDILRQVPEVAIVGEAGGGNEAIDRLRDERWDLVVLDITMPGENGIAVLRRIKQGWPDLPVIMLSMHADSDYVLNSLKSGAAGYLSKESAPEELVAAIRAVRAGQRYISRTILSSLNLQP